MDADFLFNHEGTRRLTKKIFNRQSKIYGLTIINCLGSAHPIKIKINHEVHEEP